MRGAARGSSTKKKKEKKKKRIQRPRWKEMDGAGGVLTPFFCSGWPFSLATWYILPPCMSIFWRKPVPCHHTEWWCAPARCCHPVLPVLHVAGWSSGMGSVRRGVTTSAGGPTTARRGDDDGWPFAGSRYSVRNCLIRFSSLHVCGLGSR